jgi:hypothetical protein
MPKAECRLNEHSIECRGRHTCGLKMRCRECAWVGPLRDALHEYRPTDFGQDVEPWDYCPDCQSGELQPAA